MDGRFTIDSPIKEPLLQISYTGFESQTIQVNGDGFLNIELSEGANLSEVVVSEMADQSEEKSTFFEPIGGYENFKKYIKENLQKPQAAIDAGITGKVKLGFKISGSGRPIDIEILRSLGYGCDEEAIRLLKEGPRWSGERGIVARYKIGF